MIEPGTIDVCLCVTVSLFPAGIKKKPFLVLSGGVDSDGLRKLIKSYPEEWGVG
jgi:hypothetical protein